jgi:hypothetical protein
MQKDCKMEETYLSIKQVAERLNIRQYLAGSLIEHNKLSTCFENYPYTIKKSDLDAYLKGRSIKCNKILRY